MSQRWKFEGEIHGSEVKGTITPEGPDGLLLVVGGLFLLLWLIGVVSGWFAAIFHVPVGLVSALIQWGLIALSVYGGHRIGGRTGARWVAGIWAFLFVLTLGIGFASGQVH